MVSMWLLGLASLPALAQVSRETLAKKTAIDGPGSLALDKKGHLFVAEIDGNVVRRMNLRTKTMSTVAGNGKPCCYREGAKATELSLEFPRALALDSSGNLYIAEGEFIRKVDVHTGLISTFSGRGKTAKLVLVGTQAGSRVKGQGTRHGTPSLCPQRARDFSFHVFGRSAHSLARRPWRSRPRPVTRP